MSSVGAAAKQAEQKAIKDQEAAGKAKHDLDEVAIFTKFIKRAEDTAQSAL